MFYGNRMSVFLRQSTFLLCFIVLGFADAARGQGQAKPDAQPKVLPYQRKDFELWIPPGAKPEPANGEKMLVRSATGKKQVAKLIGTVEDKLIIQRPSGELDMVPEAEARPIEEGTMKFTRADVEHVLRTAKVDKYKVVYDKPYIFVYDCSEPFFEYTREIIKSMYPGIVKQLIEWDLKPQRPKAPLIVVITPDRLAFDRLKRMPPEVLAYYSSISNHIVLYEDQAFADAAPEVALKQAAYTIVHEGVHQLLANTNIEQRLSAWPMWISEGLPEYLSPLRVKSKTVRKGTAELPVREVRWTRAGMINDLQMYELLRMRGGNGELIRSIVMAKELDADGYAVAWGLVHHLASNKTDEFKAYLKDLSKVKPLVRGKEHDAHLEELFTKHFGSDFKTLERRVQKHLTSKKMQKSYKDPIANQTRYLIKMVMKRTRTVFLNSAIITTSPAAAREWKEQQELVYPRAEFFTKICKTKREAEIEWRKFTGN